MKTVPELVAQWAASSPCHPAVIADGGALTYAGLDDAAARVARFLRESGAGPDRPVALCMGRSADAAVAMLAAWKAGAPYIPLDPAYPEARNARVLAGAQPLVLLSGIGRARQCEPLAACAPLSPDTPACIVYTSGTTGDPKGVVITHGNLAHYVDAMGRTLGLRRDDVYLHTASFAFSSAGRQMFVPLAHGACVAIAAEEARRDPVLLFRTVRERGVTILDLVPSHWRACLEALRPPLETRLRLALSASEPLPALIPAAWTGLLRQSAPFWNMFGHTETCGIVAAGPAAPAEGPSVPLGRPVPGVSIYLLDEELRPVPAGAEGDIWIGGPTVASGYWRDPALTAAKFVATSYGRLYHTGDRGRSLPGGRLEFLGRRDLQVKIRGSRVELTEVELALDCHPGVREAAAAASGDGLSAWFVPRPGAAVSAAALHAFLRARLPDYMVPARFTAVERLPRTPNGKLDRAAIAQLGVGAEPAAMVPATPTETAVAGIWRDVLQLEGVGADTDFFQSGGHSLAAARVFARLRSSLRVELPWTSIYDAPRLRQFSAVVDAALAAAETGTL